VFANICNGIDFWITQTFTWIKFKNSNNFTIYQDVFVLVTKASAEDGCYWTGNGPSCQDSSCQSDEFVFAESRTGPDGKRSLRTERSFLELNVYFPQGFNASQD